jgi:hypothetical protein
MDAPVSTADPDELMLARLAAMDMAAAQEAHARFMDAKDQGESDRAGRTYQKMARSLRQTLMLKARLAREARRDDREAAQAQAREDRERTTARKDRLKTAVEALAWRETETLSDDEHWDFHERLDALVDEEAFAEAFLTEDIGDQAARVIGRLGLRVTPEGEVVRVADDALPQPGLPQPGAPAPAFHNSA